MADRETSGTRRPRFHLKLLLFAVLFPLLVGESFPWSRFKMYSMLPEEESYVFVTDEADRPVAILPEFGRRSAFLKKVLRSYEVEIRERPGIFPGGEGAVLEEAARRTLRWLMDNRRPRTDTPTDYRVLRLYRVHLEIEEGAIARRRGLLAEVAFP